MSFDTSGIFDTRDLIEWIEDEDNHDDEDYASLKEFHDELTGYAPDFIYGETVIPDSDFEDYARELAEDCYDIPHSWPHRCIDWEQAAKELQMDYSAIEYNGTTYWVR